MEIKKLILIIDDEPDFAETMRFFLENMSFRVDTATSPEIGLKKALQKPDLILLDLNMPGMNGHEVCKVLKGQEETRYIPIVMLTSHEGTIDKVQALNLGVVDYIGKHFPVEEILARIKAIVRETTLAKSPAVDEQHAKRIFELRTIIAEKSIRTVFQPIIDMKTRAPIGYEALTRGPKGSVLESPIELFAVAYDANMLFALDTLCRDLSAERATFLADDKFLFLNTDPVVIDTEYFKDFTFLKRSKLTPKQICIEITERTCVKNFTKLSSDLGYFKSKGCLVAIDDVGEGYSSLKAVAELRPEFIKIDIALVRNIDKEEIKQTIVRTIVDLGKRVRSRLIAEGVETEAEYQKLLEMDVECGQGYLFGKPADAETIAKG